MTALLEKARGTQDDDARAALVAKAGDRLNELLPWIPLAASDTLLVMNKLDHRRARLVHVHGWPVGDDAGCGQERLRWSASPSNARRC